MAIPRILLVLGSFDPETRSILYRVREHVAERVPGDVYALILDEVELFEARDSNGKPATILVELGDEPAAMIVKGAAIQDYMPLHPAESMRNIASQIEQYEYTLTRKLRVLEKLDSLAKSAEAVIVVRHREETRCGEYIELTFLLDRGLNPRKVYMLWRNGLKLSTMVKELIIEYGFNSLDYTDEEQLLWLVEEIASKSARFPESK